MHEKILVVEDEDNIRKFIVANLEMSNFVVESVNSSEEALKICSKYNPDLAIIDIMLPGIDGYRLCEIIRKTLPQIGIIMLTAKSQDIDKITGLDKGADDYMSKPFNPMELISRINALLRRIKRVEQSEPYKAIIKIKNLKLDTVSKILYRDDSQVVLTRQEYSLIKLLMENPAKAFSRDDLLDIAWGESFFGDYKTVDVHIRRIRLKIEEDPSKPIFIQTIWGHGYRFIND